MVIEVWRTAFKAISQDKWDSPYGYKNPNRDKNEMCPYCYNEDTDIIKDAVRLRPYKEWYGDVVKKFTVVYCPACQAEWSFYEVKEENKNE